MAKESWYHVTHKETGETTFACGLGGIEEDEFEIEELPRAPDPYEEWDPKEKKLKEHPKAKEMKNRATFAAMNRGEFAKYVHNNLLAALQAEGILTEAQEARMRI